jgi:flagella basal body P-ring formation protein FlgA
MAPMPSQPTVRRLAIAALLGAIPGVAVAQAPGSPAPRTAPVANTSTDADDESSNRVAVAAHDLARGATLGVADIAYANRGALPERAPGGPTAAPAAALEPAAADDPLVGWMTRRMIAAGEPLRAPAIAAPQLVKSGDLVEVVWGHNGIVVTMRGRATRSAAVGERIAVRMDAQRKLEGTVVAPGRVRVN